MAVNIEGGNGSGEVKGWIERMTPLCRRPICLPDINGHNFTGRIEFVLEPQPASGRIICKSTTSALVGLGEGRFEAFAEGVRLLTTGTNEGGEPVLALYAETDLTVVQAVAYRWNASNATWIEGEPLALSDRHRPG